MLIIDSTLSYININSFLTSVYSNEIINKAKASNADVSVSSFEQVALALGFYATVLEQTSLLAPERLQPVYRTLQKTLRLSKGVEESVNSLLKLQVGFPVPATLCSN